MQKPVHKRGQSPRGDRCDIRACAVLSDVQGRVSAGELLGAQNCVAEVLIREMVGSPQVRALDPKTGPWL